MAGAGILLGLGANSRVHADPWLAPGNAALRHDIQLLADAGVIRSPVTTWPLSWPDISEDLARAPLEEAVSPALSQALMRVGALARRASRNGFSGWEAEAAASEKPVSLRGFDDVPREEGEVGVQGSWLSGRWSANLAVTAVADASDGRNVRLDGSYVGFAAGNVVVSFGALDRWWGPGWEGSLILSTNARPMPAISIERNHADAFKLPVLRWLGPWRATVFMAQGQHHDVAVADTRFFGARVNFRPRPWIEAGLSRSAQWCGRDRPCDLETFGDLLIGRDNRNESLTIAEEPGNQMAGYDLRVRSPWKRLPAAVYSQFIGEDEAGGLPSRLLGLFGLESWGESQWGAYRVHAEYANTSCNFSREQPRLNCAYRNTLYPQGYSYHGRIIGHALDSDGRMTSVGVLLMPSSSASVSLLLRRVELNVDDEPVPGAPPTYATRDALKNVELQYNRAFARGALGVGLGVDDYDGPTHFGSRARAFIQWRQGF